MDGEAHTMQLADDILAHITRHLPGPGIACLCFCQQRFATLLSSPAFIALRAQERLREGHRVEITRISTLPLLAAYEAVASIGLLTSNRVYFKTGSDDLCDSDDSRSLVLRAAALLRRHTSLTACIDGHTSARAPEFLAPLVTLGRARAVASMLVEHGVKEAQLEAVTGWGKHVCQMAGWQPGREATVAEIFIGFHPALDEDEGGATGKRKGEEQGLQRFYFPFRPAWYARDSSPVSLNFEDGVMG